MRATLMSLMALAALAACSAEPDLGAQLAIDRCALRDSEATCSEELMTPDEVAACMARARGEALRFPAGIPPQCRGV